MMVSYIALKMYSFDYKITPRQKDAILSTSILFRPSKHLRYFIVRYLQIWYEKIGIKRV